MTPVVSVIIPTANRPQFLPRAVDSALSGWSPGQVEVIVVPNGPDQSWRSSLRAFSSDPAVRVFPIENANANLARNVGLDKAHGEYLRFLDDDDYLILDGALRQYDVLRATAADIVSGTVAIIDASGRRRGLWQAPETDDFCVAMLSPDRCCLPTAHMFRRSALQGFRWNPKVKVRQDVDWMLHLCSAKEWKWIRVDDLVGIWQQHSGPRISTADGYNEIRKKTVPMLFGAEERLRESQRLSPERQVAVAQGLWGCIHSAFFLEPRYWTTIADEVRALCGGTRPGQRVFHWPVLSRLDPVTVEWILSPKRLLQWHLRRLLARARMPEYW